MHDIGKVARFKLDEDNNEKLFLRDSQTSLDRKISFFQSELANHSPRHDYFGYLICRHWGLSGVVEGVVRWHHEPDPKKRQKVRPDSKTAEMIDLVIVANWVVNTLEFGFSGHETAETPPDDLLERLQIYHVERIVEDIESELVQAEDFCSMLDGSSVLLPCKILGKLEEMIGISNPFELGFIVSPCPLYRWNSADGAGCSVFF